MAQQTTSPARQAKASSGEKDCRELQKKAYELESAAYQLWLQISTNCPDDNEGPTGVGFTKKILDAENSIKEFQGDFADAFAAERARKTCNTLLADLRDLDRQCTTATRSNMLQKVREDLKASLETANKFLTNGAQSAYVRGLDDELVKLADRFGIGGKEIENLRRPGQKDRRTEPLTQTEADAYLSRVSDLRRGYGELVKEKNRETLLKRIELTIPKFVDKAF